ncbi:MAG: hypothetical protein K9G48_05370 [Reyranella sp.]|nr:hypothetical protein [Reyranella sp.]
MIDFPTLIAKLESWTDGSFHTDRQLSDEILIADGWKVEPSTEFEGGVRWFRDMGGATYSCAEDRRPHPIRDLNTAVGLIPHGMDLVLIRTRRRCEASVFQAGPRSVTTKGKSPELAVAVCIAAVKALYSKALLDENTRKGALHADA